MHILEIPSFFPPHGGLFCLEQSRALKARGHEVRILSCVQLGCSIDKKFYFSAPFQRQWTDMDGIEVYSSYMRGIPKALKQNVTRWVNIVESMYEDYVGKYGKPDVIHAHCCKFAGMVAFKISKMEGMPYFITEHIPLGQYVCYFGDKWTRNTWLLPLMKQAFENATCVMPVSAELVDDIKPFFGKNYTYKTLSNVIDTDFFVYKKRKSLKDRPFRFCCLAVADIYRKGYDVLAEAWKGIENAELHIAGFGTDSEKITKLFEGSDNVTFHGHLDKQQTRDLLYDCDALVLASRSEAQPLVILEAMSTGIPVVATECVPQSERVDGACFIVPIGDAETLRDMMENVRNIPSSVAFSDKVKDIASPEVVAEQLEKIFMQ